VVSPPSRFPTLGLQLQRYPRSRALGLRVEPQGDTPVGPGRRGSRWAPWWTSATRRARQLAARAPSSLTSPLATVHRAGRSTGGPPCRCPWWARCYRLTP